jgi:hypothetical protein
MSGDLVGDQVGKNGFLGVGKLVAVGDLVKTRVGDCVNGLLSVGKLVAVGDLVKARDGDCVNGFLGVGNLVVGDLVGNVGDLVG